MDKLLTIAFDSFTFEETEQILPKELSFRLPAETLLRLQDKAIEKLRADEAAAAVLPARSAGRSRLLKTLLIAAIIAIFLAAGALAAWLSGSRFFSQLFGSENFAVVSDYIMSDVAEADDGVLRLTLESALSDGHYYHAVFSVERLDGGSVSGFLPDVDFAFTAAEPSRHKPVWQYEKLDTPENSESRVYCLAGIRSDQPITGLKMTLKGLYSAADGHRELQSDVSVEAAFLACPLARGGDGEGVYRNIELSPFGLWIDVFEPWEDTEAFSEGFPGHEITLRFVGGEAVGTGKGSGMESVRLDIEQRPNGTHQSVIIGSFFPFVDIGKVEAVVIDGEEYPVTLDLG